MERLYKKENLTFDEIIVLIQNDYDPDKKLLLLLLKEIAEKPYNIYQFFLFYNITEKYATKYDLSSTTKYLDYAFKINNYDIIKLFINNKAKVNENNLFIALKQYILYDINFLNLMFNNLSDFSVNSKYSFLFYYIENKSYDTFIFISACLTGNKRLIDKMIQKGVKEFNCGFLCACYSGKKEIIEYMLDLGAYKDNFDRRVNYGLSFACFGGHKELIEYFIQKGANNWNYGLNGACRGGNKEIVVYMVSKGVCNWNEALGYACINGNKDIIDYIISKGVDEWDGGLYGACRSGNKQIIDYMISKGGKISNLNRYDIVKFCSKDIVEYLVDKGLKLTTKQLEQNLENCKYLFLLDLLVKRSADIDIQIINI
ncbi:MAG: ankyrin repeat domain-containing protein [Candidatus Micrarchaeaceae archaeon]